MDRLTSHGLTLPEGLDPKKIDCILNDLLAGIDRDKLFQDARLTRVRHPLLAERIGVQKALNTEIYNMLVDLTDSWADEAKLRKRMAEDHCVTALTVAFRMENDREIAEENPRLESILLDGSKDYAAQQANLKNLKETTQQIEIQNYDDHNFSTPGLVSRMLAEKMALPNFVEEIVLYPVVTVHSLGEQKESALRTAEECRKSLWETLENHDLEDADEFKRLVDAEISAIQDWFQRAGI